MKRLFLATVLGLMLGGCTITAQQSRDIAAQTLDGLCDNLSSADALAVSSLKAANANGTAFQVERDAVAAVAAVCAQRPLDNPGNGLKAASAAFAKVVAVEMAARGQ